MQMKKVLACILIISILSYLILAFNPITYNTTYAEVPGTLTRDIDGLDDSRYPGYKALIKDLGSKHSNYTFLLYYTGMDWNEVLTTEYQGHAAQKNTSPRNLFQINSNYNGMWLCPLCGNKPFDNGSWCCASLEAISYMMDPRNSINESDIFQFKDLEGSDVSYDDIARVVSGYGSYINNQEAIQAIVDASNQYNVNGYYLVAKIINEHGSSGSALSNGQYSGYAGYRNYFNIGSYGNSNSEIIKNGLQYAKDNGWNSIRASIMGGATIVKEKYIMQYSQNTLYYQKFNVAGKSEVGSHQYQQNILAAQSQGTSLKNYYTSSNTVPNYTFIIPLFENMPQTASQRPNPSVKNSITYEDGIIQNMSASLLVRASANGTKIGALNNGESVKILKRATTQVDGYYWDLIVSNVDGTYGYAARTIDNIDRIVSTGNTGTSSGGASDTPQPETPPVVDPEPGDSTQSDEVDLENDIIIDEEYLNTAPNVQYEHIKEKYPDAVIKDSEGKEVESGNLGTGYSVTIEENTYKIVKKGDTNGDGLVTVTDVVVLLNGIKGDRVLENEFKEAACVKNGTEFTVTDAVSILNCIKGVTKFDIK